MPIPLSGPALETHRQALLEQLDQFGDLRPGSPVGRFKQCGRAIAPQAVDRSFRRTGAAE